MKFLTAVLVALLAAAFARSETYSPRVYAIWSFAYDRCQTQNEVWFDGGDYPRVVESLRYMNKLWPEDYETATSLGFMLGNIERYNEELAAYISYRQSNPQDPDGPLPEAEFYFRYRVFALIPPILEPAVGRKVHPNVYRVLAHSYERLNLLADSKRVWDRYILAMPKDGAAKANRERVLKKIAGTYKTATPPPVPRQTKR